MPITKRQRAEEFTDLLSTFNFIVRDPDRDGDTGDVQDNEWMQQHPDLLGEFMVFMDAFRAEIEQRFEEQG